MKRIGYYWLFLWLPYLYAESKPVDWYGGEVYNILVEYVTTDSSHNDPFYVKSYLVSDGTKDVLNSAVIDGYTNHRVFCSTYRVSLQANPLNHTIIESMRQYLAEQNTWRVFAFWTMWVLLGTNTLISLFNIAFYITFWGRYKKPIEHYAQSIQYLNFRDPYGYN